MFAFFALWYIVSVPASWGAKTGCHPATVLDWNGAVETYNITDEQYFVSLDWGLASTWGVPAEENEYQTTAATTTTSSTTIGITNLTTTKTKIGRSRRLGICVHIALLESKSALAILPTFILTSRRCTILD